MNKTTYETWYEFKEDLQKEVGRSILTHEWLGIKPREPLPWSASQMYAILSAINRAESNRAEPVQGIFHPFNNKMNTALRV